MFSFQRLEVYKLAKDIVKENYKITRSFPDLEKFALAQQMNRAAVSVPSNIAEGTSRRTTKDKIHFIGISYGSLMELVCQTEVACEQGYISYDEYMVLAKMAKHLSVKLSNFVRSLEEER